MINRIPGTELEIVQINTPRPGQSGPEIVRRWLIFYLSAFLLLWLIGVVGVYGHVRLQRKVFGWYSMAFNNADHRFGDFLEFDPVSERFISPEGVRGYNYPPPLICVYMFFTRHFNKPLHAYLLFVGSMFAVNGIGVAILAARTSQNRLLFVASSILTVCASYPVLFLIERANIEGVIFTLTAGALVAFFSRRYMTSGILIAVATSMKIFPATLFGLLYARRRYKELVISMALIVPLEVVSLWIIGPSIHAAFNNVQAGLGNLGQNYFMSYAPAVVGYDHTLFGLIKQILHIKLREKALNAAIRAVSPWYTLAIPAITIGVYFFRIRKLPALNQTMVLLIMAVTLPYISFVYTLTSVVLACSLFLVFLSRDVGSGQTHIQGKTAYWILGLMAFLFTPFQFIAGRTQIYGGQLQSIALLALIAIFLTVPLRSNFFDPPQDAARPSENSDQSRTEYRHQQDGDQSIRYE
jgi:hypothetical protein